MVAGMEIAHRFRFEAARRLPRLPDGHPCLQVHGHGFVVELVVRGEIDPAVGWVLDYATIADAWKPVAQQLDHAYLNDVDGLENPTSEIIAIWIWQRVKAALPGLYEVSLCETPETRVTYRGE